MTSGAPSGPLPTAVKEHDTTKTSVYRQGELIYDGATGEHVGGPPRGSDGPGASLNEMLKWSIQNSDPAELARRAAGGAAPPSQLDREIMDMLLGQPTVAKMRENLAKLESAELCGEGGLEMGCAALEELEFYAEDLDNALDLVKIGGLAKLRRCCAFGLLDAASATAGAEAEAEAKAEAAAAAGDAAEDAAALREAACGVLAAAVQNNPKVARAAGQLGLQTLLLALLSGGGEGDDAARAGGVAVVRKALYALSALLRTDVDSPDDAPSERTLDVSANAASAEAAGGGGGGNAASGSMSAAQYMVASASSAADGSAGTAGGGAGIVALKAALPTLCRLSKHSDAKVRRRTIFLLASLAAGSAPAATAIALAAAAPANEPAAEGGSGEAGGPSALLRGVLAALQEEDEDLRTQSARLLSAIVAAQGQAAAAGEAAAALGKRLAAEGGVAAVRAAMARAAGAEGDEGMRRLLDWLERF